MSVRLIPPVSTLGRPYWDAARSGQLVVQYCAACRTHTFPPRRHCPGCSGDALSWEPVSGRGTIHTFTIARRPPHPVFAGQCPLVIAVVELAEGPRLISNVIDCDPDAVTIGAAVQVAFDPIDDSELVLPVFRLAD